MTEKITHAIDRPNRTRIHVGPCPETDTDGDHCPGKIEAVVPTDETVPAIMRCDTCETEWTGAQWTRAGKRINARAEQIGQQRALAAAITRTT